MKLGSKLRAARMGIRNPEAKPKKKKKRDPRWPEDVMSSSEVFAQVKAVQAKIIDEDMYYARVLYGAMLVNLMTLRLLREKLDAVRSDVDVMGVDQADYIERNFMQRASALLEQLQAQFVPKQR